MGEYPHARHLSFNAYDEKSQPVDRLNDVLIQPDAGAVNPFIAGAARDSTRRGYKLHIELADVEAGASMTTRDAARKLNTLYVPKNEKPIQLWMRIYVPDKQRDAKGGVSLPAPELTLADGRKVSGAQLCKQIVIKAGAARLSHLAMEPVKTLLSLADTDSPYHPARSQPRWEAFFNPPYVLGGLLEGTRFQWFRSLLGTQRRGGFYSTLDNTYMLMYVDNRLGDALVLHGKAPTTPHTLNGDRVMGEGQLRYWSVCKYRSAYDTRFDDCLHDEQIPLDRDGNYTILISDPEVRPSNANKECSVAWLPWAIGDGIDNPHGGFLLFRNMIPNPSFQQSLFAVQHPGDEVSTLGPYYPTPQYIQKSDFEARGCKSQE